MMTRHNITAVIVEFLSKIPEIEGSALPWASARAGVKKNLVNDPSFYDSSRRFPSLL